MSMEEVALRWPLFLLCWLLAVPAVADDALERAEQALIKVPLRGDEAFLIGQGRQLRGLRPLFLRPLGDYVRLRAEFPWSLEYGLWMLKDQPVALRTPLSGIAAAPLHDPAPARSLRAAGADYRREYLRQSKGVVTVMRTALECKPGMRSPDFGPAGYQYVSTHQVAAVQIAWKRGCLATDQLRQMLPQYLGRVLAEYRATRGESLSDLQVERMAMLCFAGHCDRVESADIDRLRQAQGRDGLWLLSDNIREIAGNRSHATALAYFVLSARR